LRSRGKRRRTGCKSNSQFQKLSAFHGVLLWDMYQSAFPSLCEGSQRGRAVFCALDNAVRNAPANVVLFSEWATFANPVKRNVHIGKCSSVEATFDHGNLLDLMDATRRAFRTLIGPASRLCVPARQHGTVGSVPCPEPVSHQNSSHRAGCSLELLYLYNGSPTPHGEFQKGTVMSPRRFVRHEISFGQRLANEARRARAMAFTLPPGKMRDALLEKARLADLAARINGWLAAPELKSQP
jgi:hypothetical protein